MPSTMVYFVSPRSIARIAACLMLSGVSKSGSPRQRDDVAALRLQLFARLRSRWWAMA